MQNTECFNPSIMVRARSSSAVQTLCIPTIAKYSTMQKVLFAPQRAGGQLPSFVVVLFTCPEGILNLFLAPGRGQCKMCGKSFKSELKPKPFYVQEDSLLLILSYASSCVISLLFLTSLITSPCGSTVAWSVQTQNRQLAVPRRLLLISMQPLSGSMNFKLFSADHNNSTVSLKKLKCQQQLCGSRTWQ